MNTALSILNLRKEEANASNHAVTTYKPTSSSRRFATYRAPRISMSESSMQNSFLLRWVHLVDKHLSAAAYMSFKLQISARHPPKGFGEICDWGLLRRPAEKIEIWLKQGKIMGHLTW